MPELECVASYHTCSTCCVVDAKPHACMATVAVVRVQCLWHSSGGEAGLCTAGGWGSLGGGIPFWEGWDSHTAAAGCPDRNAAAPCRKLLWTLLVREPL